MLLQTLVLQYIAVDLNFLDFPVATEKKNSAFIDFFEVYIIFRTS